MKKYLFWAIIIILAIVGGIYLSPKATENVVLSTESQEVSKSTIVGIECHESEKYFAVTKHLYNISTGSDTLIKYKTSSDQKIPCEYIVSEGDFEVKNEDAEYFSKFTDNFLVLDSGTGPDVRRLIIYDLNKREKVYTDQYFDFPPIVFTGVDTLVYWSPNDGIAVTADNCLESVERESYGFGSVFAEEVSLNLATLERKKLGGLKCYGTN